MMQKVDFWSLLGVFHDLLQKLRIFCNAVTVEISTFVTIKQKKGLKGGMLYRNYTKIYNSNRMLQKICYTLLCLFFTIILIF